MSTTGQEQQDEEEEEEEANVLVAATGESILANAIPGVVSVDNGIISPLRWVIGKPQFLYGSPLLRIHKNTKYSTALVSVTDVSGHITSTVKLQLAFK
jgi:hypothetical protein